MTAKKEVCIGSDYAICCLQKAGLRPTRQRIALAQLLFTDIDRHVTAEQLHQQVNAGNISVSLATVYNTLHQFKSAGLLREVIVEPGQCYFDTNIGEHHHFYHVETRQLMDIHGGNIEITGLPPLPEGIAVSRIDVIIRVETQS